MTRTEYRVSDFLPQEELLAQLAEEASELSQAALKLRRVLDGRNPTPVGYQMAVKQLCEEIADVRVCMDQVHFCQESAIQETYDSKLSRWISRLREARRKEDERKRILRERE